MPENTIDKPSLLAASITSSSLIDPPGWIIDVTPASATAIRPSAKGKNASEASTDPSAILVFNPANSEAFFDLIAAICEESILLIWPAPIPTVELFFAYIIAFDFTCLAILKAKIKSSKELLDFNLKNLESKRQEFEITDLIKEYNLKNVKHNEIGRGTAWFDMGTTEDFHNTSMFVRTIQERQGLLVCSPHEIALRNDWITEKEFSKYLEKIKGSEYSENLKTIFL